MQKRLINSDDLLDATKHMMPLENIFVPRKELFQTSKYHRKYQIGMGLKLNVQSHIFSDFVFSVVNLTISN